MAFVPDEVLVDNTDPKLVKHLIDQYGAEIIPPETNRGGFKKENMR
jgi:hypothetical protein